MPGFGLAPFGGSSMFGYGSIETTDPRATTTIVARAIDPDTRDYIPSGRGFESTSPVRQRVVLALLSTFGSGAAAPKLGLQFKGQLMGEGFEAYAKDQIQRALKQLVEVEKKVRIIDIIVSRQPFRAVITVGFKDLTNPDSKPEFLKIPVRQ